MTVSHQRALAGGGYINHSLGLPGFRDESYPLGMSTLKKLLLGAFCGAVFGLFMGLRQVSQNEAVRMLIAGIGAGIAAGIYIFAKNYTKAGSKVV